MKILEYILFMKQSTKKIKSQRRIIDKKLKSWQSLRTDKRPPRGWLRAIRESLGMSIKQLAKRIGVSNHSSILRLEERESQGKATIVSLSKAAEAMDCKLIYAIVPKKEFSSLEKIIDKQAEKVAIKIVKEVDHTMKLESQGISKKELKHQITEVSKELKSTMSSSLWEDTKK